MLSACGTKALLEGEHSRQGHCSFASNGKLALRWFYDGCHGHCRQCAPCSLHRARGARLALGTARPQGPPRSPGLPAEVKAGQRRQTGKPSGVAGVGGRDGGREGFVWGLLCECVLSLPGKPHSVKVLGFLKRNRLSEEAGHMALRPHLLRSAHPEPVDSPGHKGRPGPGTKALPPGFPRG